MNISLTIWRNNTLVRGAWVLLDGEFLPRDLAGYSFRLVAKNRSTGVVAFDYSVVDDDGVDGPLRMIADEGKVSFGLEWDETSDLPIGRFDLELQETSPEDVRLISGKGVVAIRQTNFDG